MAAAQHREFAVFVDKLDASASLAIAAAAHAGEVQIAAEQSARRGIAPGEVSAVDGIRGRSFEQVKPTGEIVLIFDYRSEVVYAILQELAARSPIVSGAYRRSHFVMLDGAPLPPMTAPSAEQVKDVRRITITNPMPYARRLEVGLTKTGRAFVRQVEPHIYARAALAVDRTYNSVAEINFNFTTLPNVYVATTNFAKRAFVRSRDKSRFRIAKTSRKDRGKGVAITYPCIHIDIKEY